MCKKKSIYDQIYILLHKGEMRFVLFTYRDGEGACCKCKEIYIWKWRRVEGGLRSLEAVSTRV